MPHVKLDFSRPEMFLEVLKTMDLPEGGVIEPERVKDGVLLKPVVADAGGLFDIPKGVCPRRLRLKNECGFSKPCGETRPTTTETSTLTSSPLPAPTSAASITL